MLDLVDLRLEARERVVLLDANGLLADDRPAVELLVGKVHRDPRDLHAVLERVMDRGRAGERRQERRVQVDDRVRKGFEYLTAEQPHVAGHHDELDAVGLERLPDRVVVRARVAVARRIEMDGRDCGLPGAFDAVRGLLIGDDHRHARVDRSARAGVDDRLQVGAASRDEHAQRERADLVGVAPQILGHLLLSHTRPPRCPR